MSRTEAAQALENNSLWRKRGRSAPVTAIQTAKWTSVCKVTEADVAKVTADDSMEITMSLRKHMWTNAMKKPNEVLGGMIMSQSENVSILARCGENAKHRRRITGRQTQYFPAHSNHCSLVTSTCQGCAGRQRTKWTLCERDHQRRTRAQDERLSCVRQTPSGRWRNSSRKCNS